MIKEIINLKDIIQATIEDIKITINLYMIMLTMIIVIVGSIRDIKDIVIISNITVTIDKIKDSCKIIIRDKINIESHNYIAR